jgi:hypothetical protein
MKPAPCRDQGNHGKATRDDRKTMNLTNENAIAVSSISSSHHDVIRLRMHRLSRNSKTSAIARSRRQRFENRRGWPMKNRKETKGKRDSYRIKS